MKTKKKHEAKTWSLWLYDLRTGREEESLAVDVWRTQGRFVSVWVHGYGLASTVALPYLSSTVLSGVVEFRATLLVSLSSIADVFFSAPDKCAVCIIHCTVRVQSRDVACTGKSRVCAQTRLRLRQPQSTVPALSCMWYGGAVLASTYVVPE